MKSTNTSAFMECHGWNCKLIFVNSSGHLATQPEVPGRCHEAFNGWSTRKTIVLACKQGSKFQAEIISAKINFLRLEYLCHGGFC